MEIDAHAFNPPQLNVAPGTTVKFVNNDTEPHTGTADNGLFNTGVLEPGYSFDVVLDGGRDGNVPLRAASRYAGEHRRRRSRPSWWVRNN